MSLARQGKIKEAQALLIAERPIPQDDLALELLAMLVTSEGDYLRGLRLWEQLQQRKPQHAEAKRMIGAIELWLSRPSWMRYAPLGAATVAAVAAAGIFIWALRPMSPPPKARSVPVSESPIGTPVPSRPAYPSPAANEPTPSTPPPMVSFPPPTASRKPRSNH